MDSQFPSVASRKQQGKRLWCVLQALDDMELPFDRSVRQADS